LLHRGDFEQQTGIKLPEGPYDTVAGFFISQLGRVPNVGESIEALGHRFTVRDMDAHRVSRLLITPLDRDT
ncbi:hypothetical protein LH612_29370, partial [Klebsiella pneumoniae]|nr:hypothetical protein [Klebsiella pneumoniae]